MKFSEILDKTKGAAKKAGVKTLSAVCAVLVIGSVVGVNLIMGDKADDGGDKKMALDLSSDTPTSGQDGGTATLTDEIENYFAEATLKRRQARDEAIEVLKTVTENEGALEEARQAAAADINRIVSDIEKEADIETLVTSKGFEECIAVINDGKCNIIVKTVGLLPGDVAQISEIVYENAGITPENLKIIEKNVNS